MFRMNKTRDIISIFRNASCPASVRIIDVVKQAAIKSQAAAAQAKQNRNPFELDIGEFPTVDQVRTILDYVGVGRHKNIIKNAHDKFDAIKKFESDEETLRRPLIVDWNNGRVMSGGDEFKILEMLSATRKD